MWRLACWPSFVFAMTRKHCQACFCIQNLYSASETLSSTMTVRRAKQMPLAKSKNLNCQATEGGKKSR